MGGLERLSGLSVIDPVSFQASPEARCRIRGFLHQGLEVLRWIATVKHAPERCIRIRPAASGAQGRPVVDLSQHNDLGFAVESEEQSVLLVKLHQKPVLAVSAECMALAELRCIRTDRNDFGNQSDNCGKALCAVHCPLSRRMEVSAGLNLPDQLVELIKKRWVCKIDQPLMTSGTSDRAASVIHRRETMDRQDRLQHQRPVPWLGQANCHRMPERVLDGPQCRLQ